jgi:hypothetical protein
MNVFERFPLPEIPESKEGIAPADQFAEEIELRVATLNDCVEDLIERRMTFAPYTLITIEGQRNNFIQHYCMLKFLSQRNLLDRYYEDASAIRYKNRTDWEVVLNRPLSGTSLTEEYRIESREPNSMTDSDRHLFILRYKLNKF